MFYYKFGEEIKEVSKITRENFTKGHIECISNIQLMDKLLYFENKKWKSVLLGAGEEKAVYCVCDEDNQVFALELIDEKHYLNGRLIDGEYFCSVRANNLIGKKLNPDCLIGLNFTGLIKAREFIYGYEWDQFRFSPIISHKILDLFLTEYLKSSFAEKFRYFSLYYKDVHDRNIMFEINKPDRKKTNLVIKNYNDQKEKVSIQLRAIDVR